MKELICILVHTKTNEKKPLNNADNRNVPRLHNGHYGYQQCRWQHPGKKNFSWTLHNYPITITNKQICVLYKKVFCTWITLVELAWLPRQTGVQNKLSCTLTAQTATWKLASNSMLPCIRESLHYLLWSCCHLAAQSTAQDGLAPVLP